MRKEWNLLVAAAAIVLLAAQGCKKSTTEEEPVARSGSGTASVSEPSGTMSAQQTQAPAGASSGISSTAGEAQTAGDAAAARAADAAAKPAADAAAAGTSATEVQAQKLLDDAAQYIRENKWDLADKSLTSLEQMKSQLPASYGPKIDAGRKMFNTAKSGSPLLGTGAGGTK